ncbi:uncharacterized protein METZ01_LOCUS386935, partial [marine metagenome]
MDGFTLRDGRTGGSGTDMGGGIYNIDGSPQIANCTIINNDSRTGGIYNRARYSTASPTFTNCTISDNKGLGISNKAENSDAVASPTFTNCTISGNVGNGISNLAYRSKSTANPTFTNCIITGNIIGLKNVAQDDNAEAVPRFINCTISGNKGSRGSAFDTMGGGKAWPIFTNCILWGNQSPNSYFGIGTPGDRTIFSYSNIEKSGGSGVENWALNMDDDGNNIDSDPRFVNPIAGTSNSPVTSEGDYHLTRGSPSIDAGNNDANTEALDLDGEQRIEDDNSDGVPVVDMGPY